ncbi:hypothetical protein ABIC80_004677 [Kosakonia sp. 1610]
MVNRPGEGQATSEQEKSGERFPVRNYLCFPQGTWSAPSPACSAIPSISYRQRKPSGAFVRTPLPDRLCSAFSGGSIWRRHAQPKGSRHQHLRDEYGRGYVGSLIRLMMFDCPHSHTPVAGISLLYGANSSTNAEFGSGLFSSSCVIGYSVFFIHLP